MERCAVGCRAAGLRAAAVALLWTLAACSFDYGESAAKGEEEPDLVMEDLEYVRVVNGKPVLRFQAARAERYEASRTMHVSELRFEQFASSTMETDAVGQAAAARINLASGDAFLAGGVRINVPGEDLAIETAELYWADGERTLRGRDDGAVLLKRSDGTIVSGIGFSADVRRRTWQFSGQVSGTYVEREDGGDDAAAEAAEAAEAAAEDAGTGTAPAPEDSVPEYPEAP